MTKEELKDLYTIRRIIIRKENEIEEKYGNLSPNSKLIDGMPFCQTNTISNPTEDKVIDAVDCIIEIERLSAMATIIIRGLARNEDRMIFELYFIKHKSWKDIAEELGESSTKLRKRFSRIIKEINN